MESEDMLVFCAEDSHSIHLSAIADMRESDQLCDVIIKVENERFAAHRVILASVFPYFRAMFTCNMKESVNREVLMKDIEPVVLKSFIDFAYTRVVRVPVSKARSFIKTASYLLNSSLGYRCLNCMWSQINPNNVLTFRDCAVAYDDDGIVSLSDRYVIENFDRVAMSEEFLDLPPHTLKEFICKDDLYVLTEETVFECVIRWVKADHDARSDHLPELLRLVRLPLLTPEYLDTRVSAEQLIRTSPACRCIVDNAKVEHFLGHPATKERYCRVNQHLKCAKLVGYGTYSVGTCEGGKISINYYDHILRRWTGLASITNSSEGPEFIACTEQSIYVIGYRLMWAIDFETLKCTFTRVMPSSPKSAGITLHNNQVYFFGGYTPRLVHRLDLQTGMCSQIGLLLTDRVFPGVVSLGESIYVTGGSAYGNSVEKFNPATGESIEVSPMLTQRSNHECAVVGGKIYVCGGHIRDSTRYPRYSYTDTAEVYDPSTDRWSFVSQTNSIKISFSLFSKDDKLYAVDTYSEDDSDFQVETYDFDQNEWTDGESLTFPDHKCFFHKIVLTNSASGYSDEK